MNTWNNCAWLNPSENRLDCKKCKKLQRSDKPPKLFHCEEMSWKNLSRYAGGLEFSFSSIHGERNSVILYSVPGTLEDLIRYDQFEWQVWGDGEEEEKQEEQVEGYEFEYEDEEAEMAKDIEDTCSQDSDSKKNQQTSSVETIITQEDEIQNASLYSNSSSKSSSSLMSSRISDSEVKLLRLFNAFPIPDDPGNVQAFWILYDPVPIYTNDGIQRFTDTMKTSNLRPIACMYDLLRSDVVNLRYYGLDPRAVKAICQSVYNNTSVQSLDLKDNWLTREACVHLNNLLLESEILSHMNLSGCRIGCEGIKCMLSGLTENWSLVELDLSNCQLKDDGFNSLAPVVENNQLLETLNLSDNQLGTECAKALEAMLAHNNHLLHLDLSWNGLFTKEASNGLFKGLIENKTLLSLNLSWNALGKEALVPLGTFLQQNQTLLSLNMSGNRFDEQAAVTIANSLAKNVGLQDIYLGDNPLKSAGGLALVHALIPEQSPRTELRHVNLENVWINKTVLPDLENIRTNRSWIRIKLGGIFSNHKLVGPDEKKIFFKRAIFEGMKPKKKKQRKDFGHFILSLEEKLNSRDNFKELVKGFKIKLSETLIHALMTAFPGANKKVDQAAMKAFYLQQYPDTIAPPPPTPKKKKGKRKKLDNEKRKEQVDDVLQGRKGSTKKSKVKSAKTVKLFVSNSGTEGETDEFEDEEEYGDGYRYGGLMSALGDNILGISWNIFTIVNFILEYHCTGISINFVILPINKLILAVYLDEQLAQCKHNIKASKVLCLPSKKDCNRQIINGRARRGRMSGNKKIVEPYHPFLIDIVIIQIRDQLIQ
ncbi:uncharacterized protein LOC124405954 [Diprion similis]|uniref:uncharacterized protein LOC124405954 n=1 Tax=Diprion similis TaxID=362088 RepID=UPI001EF8E790|nr:uncharacterized protein LOC124405954 [Diprion similis]